ncbi:MAG: TraR/DksA family transcriptional regulator [Candidatus Omnitrophota bacterium]|nr:TraR/DksA family transcriptional regulator [Candidatus Omnitrophota bacterium]
MDKREREKFKSLLLERREQLSKQIDDLEEQSLRRSQREFAGDLSGYAYHMADVGTDNYNRQVNLGLVSNEQKILYEIDQALLRIKEKMFGKCEVCGCRIDNRRLKIVPYARLCINCKELKEQEELSKGKINS